MSNKGSAMLASVLQRRMSQVAIGNTSISVETGEILAGRKLKLSSLPNAILDKDDYSVCAGLQAKMPCQKSYPINPGDQVLVAWTFDGEPVVVDKILRADRSGAVQSCGWEKICPDCEALKNKIASLESSISALRQQVESLK